jgi:DNA-binding NtrC family response regulator
MGSTESASGTRWVRPPADAPAPPIPPPGGSEEAPSDHDADAVRTGMDDETKSGIGVLIVDDEDTIRESCASVLEQEGYRVKTAHRGEDALQLLQRRSFDIVLLDLYMKGIGGMKLLTTCLETSPDTVVIIMTGNPSVESSLAALRAGAWDYLPKPFSSTQLHVLLGRAGHAVTVARETRRRRTSIHMEHGHGKDSEVPFIGESGSFKSALEMARRVARTDASVFLTGESGAGKEMFAQYIHAHSRRNARPMVAVNCAALPETLLESEMFGHVKGAFTGAVKDKPGLLEAAHRGSLFLDELGEMSLTIQAKLLRVLQDGVVRRVGSSSTDAVVDVRFIVATNQDPLEAVEAGRLRRDLYYRLRVVPLHVPPLRDRPGDIPLLANHFLLLYWRRHRELGEAPPRFADEALRELQRRSWPGNVRELQNVMEHLVVLAEANQEIRPEHLPAAAGSAAVHAHRDGSRISEAFLDTEYHLARERLMAEFEQAYLERLVRESGGNMSEAARQAGVDRTTLYRLMQKHDLEKRDLMDRPEGNGVR